MVIAIGPSRRLEGWITALSALAVAVTVMLPAPWPMRAFLVVAIWACAVRSARRDALRVGAGAVTRVIVDLAGRVSVVAAGPTIAVGRLAEGSFVAPWLTVVRWRPDGARLARTVVLAPDAVDADDFRRLRVLLRWR